jgi:hypothetical protein
VVYRVGVYNNLSRRHCRRCKREELSLAVETTIFAQYACVNSCAISSNGQTTIVGLKTTKREWGLSFGGAISLGQTNYTRHLHSRDKIE